MKKEKEATQIIKVDKDETASIEVFGRIDYDIQVERAKKVSEVVSKIVEQKKLYAMIQGKKYVTCEGWTTMGSLLGLFPQIVEVREERNEKGIKYIAVCEIRTLDGKLVSRAESECASWERNKAKMLEQQGEYAIRSMAETRAVSKAYRICLSWIMTLAGYEPTPAEEVIIDQQVEQETQAPVKPVEPKKITVKQRNLIYLRASEAKVTDEQLHEYIKKNFNKDSVKDLNNEEMDKLLQDLEKAKQDYKKLRQYFDEIVNKLRDEEKEKVLELVKKYNKKIKTLNGVGLLDIKQLREIIKNISEINKNNSNNKEEGV